MTMSSNCRSLLTELIEEGLPEGYSIRLNYSGRGMYGKDCVGIVGPNPLKMFCYCAGTCVDVHYDRGDIAVEFFDLLSNHKQDSMGRDTIIYFPEWNVDEDDAKPFQDLIDNYNSEDGE